MKNVSFAPFEPDKALLGGSHAPEARGVIPSASGYGPLAAPEIEANLAALPGAFRGAFSFFDQAGNPVTIAGTTDGLYKRVQGEWQTLGAGYAADGGFWDFARYGNTLVAVNGADAPQYAAIGPGLVSDFRPIEGAPVGSSVEVVKEFVVIGGVERTKLRWSAIGNPLDWPEPGGNDAAYRQSDEQDFPDTGNAVAVAGGLTGMDMVIFAERAVYRGQYVGAPLIFQFDILDKGRGVIAPRSVITGNNALYYLSEEGFFATDGGSVRNIGFERINTWFRNASDPTRRDEVQGARDPYSGVIFWTFASLDAPSRVHDRLLIYHPQLDRWSWGETRTAGLFTDLSTGKTLEQLNALGPLDTLPYSLDAKIWQGGVPGLAGFAPENRLFRFSGPPVRAVIDTAETGGARMLVHGVRPLVDGAVSRASVWHRDFQHQAARETACAAASSFDGIAYTHVSTRYARARVSIPAGATWTHAVGCDVLVEGEGSV